MHFIPSSTLHLFFSIFLLSPFIHAQLLPLAPASQPSASTAPVQSKRGPWKCDLAQDGSGIPQQPYCCDEDSIFRRYQDGRILAVSNCTAVPSDQNVQCAHAADVWCCYGSTGNAQTQGKSEWACTSVAKWEPSS